MYVIYLVNLLRYLDNYDIMDSINTTTDMCHIVVKSNKNWKHCVFRICPHRMKYNARVFVLAFQSLDWHSFPATCTNCYWIVYGYGDTYLSRYYSSHTFITFSKLLCSPINTHYAIRKCQYSIGCFFSGMCSRGCQCININNIRFACKW